MLLITLLYFFFLSFQRHVHTYRILPDADGLLAVQVSFLRHVTLKHPALTGDERKEKHNRHNLCDMDKHSWSDGVGGIKQWFVFACCKENKNIFVFSLHTGSLISCLVV